MKPNTQQEQWLREYLDAVFTYRESYEEVYDHIVSALETHPVQQTFEATVHHIIDDDFGGINGLMVIQEIFKDNVIAQTRAQYNGFFKWTKFPTIIIAIALIVFFTVARVKHLFFMFMPGLVVHVLGYFLLLPVVMVIIPLLLLGVRYLKTSYTYGNANLSAKDSIIKRLAYTPFRVFFYIIAFEVIMHYLLKLLEYLPYKVLHFLAFYSPIPIISSAQLYLLFIAILTLPVLHLLAFYKVYRSEFKISITR